MSMVWNGRKNYPYWYGIWKILNMKWKMGQIEWNESYILHIAFVVKVIDLIYFLNFYYTIILCFKAKILKRSCLYCSTLYDAMEMKQLKRYVVLILIEMFIVCLRIKNHI